MSRLYDIAAAKREVKEPIDYFRAHHLEVYVWPLAWGNAATAQELNWGRVEFGQDTKEDVPEKSGVYAFCVSVKGTIMPSHGVLVYFGQTYNLRERYKQYLRDCKIGAKRPKFENLFNLWPDHLDFFFAPIDDTDCDLEEIEAILNDAVIPHCVTRDFSAEVRRMVKILRGG